MRKILKAALVALALAAIGYAVCMAIYVDSLAGAATARPTTPGLPTPPPSLPTQVTNGDGTRMNCTPDYRYCWPAH